MARGNLSVQPVLGKREQTKARNRAVIVAAARRVFATLGFERATVRDVVRATGLSVGTFYEYFRDKQEIATAIAEEAWAELRRRLREIRRDRHVPLEERSYRAYLAFFRFVRDEKELSGVLDRLLLSGAGLASGGALAAAIDDLREDLVPDREAGVVADDPDVLSAAIMGASVMTARRLLARGDLDPEAAAAFCSRFVLHGALSGAPSAPRPVESRTRRQAPPRPAGRDA